MLLGWFDFSRNSVISRYFSLGNRYSRRRNSGFRWFLFSLYRNIYPRYIRSIFMVFWITQSLRAIYIIFNSACHQFADVPHNRLWDRWITTLFISQFMFVLYFVAVNDTDAVGSLKRLIIFLSRHSFLFAVMIIYLTLSIFSNSYSVYLSVMLKHIDNFLSFA